MAVNSQLSYLCNHLSKKEEVERQDKKPRVAFHTLGCKLNFAETATIARTFTDKGYEKVDFNEPADIYIINTCSVTEQANKKCRQAIKQASHHGGKVVVIGCYSQLKPEEIAAIQGVDIVLGTRDKFNVLQRLNDIQQGVKQRIYSSCIDSVKGFNSSFSLDDRTRAFLKVQDGCDYHCSYCTIPLARGKSRNPEIEQIITNAKAIAENGVREVVLTGVNIGDFGQGEDLNFFTLIKALEQVEGIYRYRISSIEPNLITPEIIDFTAQSTKFAPHFHIPLQSGSNKILALMSRRYKRELYASRVREIQAKIPHACIGSDVIVGFPGETDADFEEAYAFIRDMGISYLHVFPYSERPDTMAINFTGKVPAKVKEERVKRLIELSDRLRHNFYASNLGSEQQVLFEGKFTNGMMGGFTGNYIRVKHPADEALIGRIANVTLDSFNTDGHINGSINRII